MKNVGIGYTEFEKMYWTSKYYFENKIVHKINARDSFIWVLGANFVKENDA